MIGTPRDKATEERTKQCFELLFERKRKPFKSPKEYTPTAEENAELVSKVLTLIEEGVYVHDVAGDDDETLLHLAPLGEIAEALLRQGAKVGAQDNVGCTPLHSAASRDYREVALALLAHGADVNARAIGGNTPLLETYLYAETYDTSGALLSYGANVYAANNANERFKDYTDIRPAHRSDIVDCRDQYDLFQSEGKPPENVEQLYQVLCVWPLADPHMHIPQEQQLRVIFSHVHWEGEEKITPILNGLRERGISAEFCDMLREVAEENICSCASYPSMQTGSPRR